MTKEFDVTKVAKLAKLQLTKEEEKDLEDKFSDIMDYMDILSEVDMSLDVENKDESHQMIYREDKAVPSEVNPEQFSGFIVDRFFKVPRVIE